MSIDQLKKNFCNICGYCFVEWWVKPNNISRKVGLKLILNTPKINDKNQKIDFKILFGLTMCSPPRNLSLAKFL